MFLRTLILLLLTVLVPPAQAKIQIQLKEFAQAQSRQVTLNDIAIVQQNTEGFNAEILGQMVVATIAHINQPLLIDAKHLERLIARQQPALRDKLQFIGATSVSVLLPGDEISFSQVIDAAKTFLRTELAKHSSQLAIHEGKVERNALLVPKGSLKFSPRFSSGSSEPEKMMHVTVDIFVNDKRIDSIPVNLEIASKEVFFRTLFIERVSVKTPLSCLEKSPKNF